MKRVAIALVALAAATPAAAARWAVDPAQSRIGFTASWLGNKVAGAFGRWTAAIDFDPAVPGNAVVGVTIDLTSATTGDRTVDGALPGDDWFATRGNRQARFVATRIAAAGPGRYVATGVLTIRGQAVPVTLPFALAITGDTATMTGTAQLDRRAWKLGLGSDAVAEYVGFAVPLTVKVVARRAG